MLSIRETQMGTETPIDGDHLREKIIMPWEWGDALFIVFDPFQYTMA